MFNHTNMTEHHVYLMASHTNALLIKFDGIIDKI